MRIVSNYQKSRSEKTMQSKSHDSPVVRIPGCLPGDLGSIPSRGVFYFYFIVGTRKLSED